MAAVNALVHSCNVLNGVLTSDRFTDLNILTEKNEVIKVHKVIIANVSKKVDKWLHRNDDKDMVIRNVKYQSLKSVVDFIYNGRVDIEDTDALVDFADTYQLLQINLGPKVNKMVQNITLNAGTSDHSDAMENSQEFKCENCDKGFVTKSKFARHMRDVHNKDRPKRQRTIFSCEKCGEVYTVNQNLNSHTNLIIFSFRQ